jgi:CxxC motif-containing protein (DUF1111 family)
MLCHSKISEITPNLTIKMFTNLSTRQLNYLVCTSLFLFSLNTNSEASLPESLSIEVKDVIEWDTTSGQTYQLQKSTTSGVWNDEGSLGQGDGHSVQHELHTLEPDTEYRVIKTINGHENDLAIWSAFAGSGTTVSGDNNDVFEFPNGAQAWAGFANDTASMYPLGFSSGGTITFTAYVPNGGTAHIFFRFEKNPYPDVNPHFNIGSDMWQDQLDMTASVSMPSWPSRDSAFVISGATPNEYSISIPSQGSNTFRSFIFYIVEENTPVVLKNVRVTDDSTVAGEEEVVSLTPEKVTEVSFPSLNGVEYDIMESSNLMDWTDYGSNVMGNGNTQTITMTMEQASRFIRVVEPTYELFAPTDAGASQSLIENAISISWNPSTTPTVVGYRVYYGTDSSNLDQIIDVTNGNSVTVTDLIPETTYYFAIAAYTSDEETDPSATLFSATPAQSITLVPLFDATTTLEPETTIDTEQALYTYVSDRGRGRHAREVEIASSPALYDIYLDSYWNGRAYYFEIIDRVGKAEWVGTPLENTITINSTFQYDLAAPEMRTFYLGTGTVANYYYNYNPLGPGDTPEAGQRGHRTVDGTNIDTNSIGKYTYTFRGNPKTGQAMKTGDRMEIELSVFGLPPTNKGRSNYYGAAFLYIIGEGMKPWYAHKDLSVKYDYTYSHGEQSDLHPLPTGAQAYQSDSYPLPESAWLGGKTTHHTQYSAEPKRAYKQMAYNLAPINSQPFMDGRRLHHTDFEDGSHSEPDNDIFYTHVGKRGPDFINTSCVACHTNNGRAIPNNPGDLMTQSVVRVGIDSSATIHPTLGTVLQVQSTSGSAEKTAYRAAYTEIPGTYGDGTSYSLRKPNYTFGGEAPDFYSVRTAPQLVGLGLLEAVAEETIVNLSDPNDINNDGISGRINALNDPETGEIRLGRFGYKASKARLRHHIASALNTDMGVTTTIYPTIDFKNTTASLEINDSELDLMYRYVALLALMPQRDFNDSDVIQGKELFTQANCVACHVETIQTSDYHPLTELRNQTIHPYSDLLLHDMGTGLADNMGEGLASGSEWRTAPLWNIGYTEYVSYDEAYLHDGRARTLEEAILWHGGEAEASKEAFRTMSASDRSKLITFLKSL